MVSASSSSSSSWSLLLLLLGLCFVLFLLLLLLLGGRGYWPMGLPQRVIIAWTSLQDVLRCLVLRAAGTHRGEGTNLVPVAMYVVVHSVVPRTPSQSLMPYQGVTIICQARSKSDLLFIKPVLNWANVCSPNILPTVRRTMIRLLTELLVRRTWFGQSKLYFVLNWLVMRCRLRPELAADAQQTA